MLVNQFEIIDFNTNEYAVINVTNNKIIAYISKYYTNKMIQILLDNEIKVECKEIIILMMVLYIKFNDTNGSNIDCDDGFFYINIENMDINVIQNIVYIIKTYEIKNIIETINEMEARIIRKIFQSEYVVSAFKDTVIY